MSHLAYTFCEARLFQQSPEEVHSMLTSLLYNYWNVNINQSHNEYISISLVLPNKKTREIYYPSFFEESTYAANVR